MHYYPCFGCLIKKSCTVKDDIRMRLKTSGLSTILSSVKFTCKIVQELIPPGQRVSVNFWSHGSRTATVMGWNRSGKLRVWLDKPFHGRHGIVERVVLRRSDRVTLLQEEKVVVCSDCGRPKNRSNSTKWDCCRCDSELGCAGPCDEERWHCTDCEYITDHKSSVSYTEWTG